MNLAGCKRKFNTDDYIAKYGGRGIGHSEACADGSIEPPKPKSMKEKKKAKAAAAAMHSKKPKKRAKIAELF